MEIDGAEKEELVVETETEPPAPESAEEEGVKEPEASNKDEL